VYPIVRMSMKDAGMRIRVAPELRDKFVNLCRYNDLSDAQVLRSFLRDFVQTNSDSKRLKVEKQLASAKLIVQKVVSQVEL
jgi:hypothetical protein